MINAAGDDFRVEREGKIATLDDLMLDIGIVKQNESKDLLLNHDHERVDLASGEIAMPVILQNRYSLEIGDEVHLTLEDLSLSFVLKEFDLDAQMNSTMASLTRVLVSDEDFDRLLRHANEDEFIIEAYFEDANSASDFQTIYEDRDMPSNGQAITYTMMFLLSALTDILKVFILLLVGSLLVIVSFICIRFTVLSTLEEDVRELGTIKAIGFFFKDIRDLYLAKYRVLSLIGVALGYLTAIGFSRVLTRHISTTFGAGRLSGLTLVLSLVVAGLVYALNIMYCKRVLRRIRKLSVVQAITRGEGFDLRGSRVKDGLHKSLHAPVNLLLPLREVFHKFRQWTTIPMVLLITMFMVLVPLNLWISMSSPTFVNHLGNSFEDVIIELPNTAERENHVAIVRDFLEHESSIDNYSMERTVRVKAMSAAETGNLSIDVGEQAGVGLQYLQGRAPSKHDEIALSTMNADALQVEVGYGLSIQVKDETLNLKVSGVYQDVSSGGKTAKSLYPFRELPSERYSFDIALTDRNRAEELVENWSNELPAGIQIYPPDAYIEQSFGTITGQLGRFVAFIGVSGIGIAILIAVLFLRLRLAKDTSQIGILRAVGFSLRDLKLQYVIKIIAVSILGIAAGILLSNLIGESLVSFALALANLGITKIHLQVNPWLQYVAMPGGLLLLIYLASRTVLLKLKHQNIMHSIRG